MKPEGSAHKLSWYAWIAIAVVSLFVVLVVYGLESSVYTHGRYSADGGYSGSVYRVVNNAKQLAICIKLHASDAEGKHPHTLVELVNEGILDDQRALDTLLAHPYKKPQEPLGWIYLPDLSDKTPDEYPLLFSPVLQDKPEPRSRSRIVSFFMSPPSRFPTTPHRVVAHCDTAVEIMTEAKFQELLKTHGITLPANADTAEK